MYEYEFVRLRRPWLFRIPDNPADVVSRYAKDGWRFVGIEGSFLGPYWAVFERVQRAGQ
jgi:hypothetical protein